MIEDPRYAYEKLDYPICKSVLVDGIEGIVTAVQKETKEGVTRVFLRVDGKHSSIRLSKVALGEVTVLPA